MKSINDHLNNIKQIQQELALQYQEQQGLFNLSEYMTERNNQIVQANPESAEACHDANKRIADMKARYDAADPMSQLKMLGVKSGKKQEVLTPEQDNAKRKSRHAESNLQLKCLSWVKKWFPNDRTIVHKREGQRQGFNRAVLSTLNNNSDGYPDHEFNCATQGLLYVEFKRPGESWLMKDGKTVKTAYRHQYRMHVKLWSEGKSVYFCNDFDAFRELYKAFKNGKPLPQQVYVCPE